MKAKRILSILLTGSMLLSLLPVSALAAAPVFDAPCPDHGQKGCTPCAGGRRLPQHRGGSRHPQQP